MAQKEVHPCLQEVCLANSKDLCTESDVKVLEEKSKCEKCTEGSHPNTPKTILIELNIQGSASNPIEKLFKIIFPHTEIVQVTSVVRPRVLQSQVK
ncbi:hypothetical protein CEXT_395511 [Caerostris extrusa]|uniref:Uncharacterized protein n=1 Tax=Caerostris extrusa TaxID=172846 RepID=A0AAV4TAB5_CAEEX|nr:hypothetical protein CEXT_395511 [Caerostris extrusa]